MDKEGMEEFFDIRKSLEENLNQVVGATSKLLEPLKGLSDDQRDAVVMLGLMMQSIALAKRPPAKMSEDILVQFKEALDEICPPLGKVAISKDPCFEATVSYVSALAKCQAEGRREEECHEAWGPGSMAAICLIKKFKEMKTDIEALLGGQKPPKPIPWPIEHSRK